MASCRERRVDPARRDAEGWLGGIDAGDEQWITARREGQQPSHHHLLARDLDAHHLQRILAGIEVHVVLQTHRWQQEAIVERDRAAQLADLFGQTAIGAGGQRDQPHAEFDPDVIDPHHVADRFVA